jgi:hypothetical protein
VHGRLPQTGQASGCFHPPSSFTQLPFSSSCFRTSYHTSIPCSLYSIVITTIITSLIYIYLSKSHCSLHFYSSFSTFQIN